MNVTFASNKVGVEWIANEAIMKEAGCTCLQKNGLRCDCKSYNWVDSDAEITKELLKFSRPPIKPREYYVKNDYIFCMNDVDYKMDGNQVIIRLYGVTEDGNSVMCHVTDFQPYFFVQFSEHLDPILIGAVETTLKDVLRRNKIRPNDIYLEEVSYFSTSGFNENPIPNLYKVTVRIPTAVSVLRKVFKDEDPLTSLDVDVVNTYEGNVEFVLRFAIDKKMPGCCFIRVPYEKCILTNYGKISRCQLEFRVSHEDLVIYDPTSKTVDPRWKAIPPFRLLSYDIEVRKRGDHFPTAKNDPIFQICVELHDCRTKESHSVGLTLGTCLDVKGATVLRFKREKFLLLAFSRLIQIYDADLITGYNINKFDCPFLIERSEVLKIKNQYTRYSRVYNTYRQTPFYVKLRKSGFDSKQVGAKMKSFQELCPGRVIMDNFKVVRKGYNLRSYKLNNVAKKLLGEMKDDIHHSAISPLCDGDARARWLLLKYCLKDALLPMKLLLIRQMYINSVMMSRETRVPTLTLIVEKGQTIKVKCKYLTRCRERGFIEPTREYVMKDGKKKFKGAWVASPVPGLYTWSEDSFISKTIQKKLFDSKDPTDLSMLRGKPNPVSVMDFVSLYPSIMIAYNICFTTLLTQKQVGAFDRAGKGEGIGYYEIPTKPRSRYFATPNERKGLLPEILVGLLSKRKIKKKEMNESYDDGRKLDGDIANGQQLALKVTANSVYGFCGFVGNVDVSESVTGVGRFKIKVVKDFVEKNYTVKNGHVRDAKVIYGDTISEFCFLIFFYTTQ